MHFRTNSRAAKKQDDVETTEKKYSMAFVGVFAFVHVACIVLAFVTASEYQKTNFKHAHHMFKLVDIMYVAGSLAVGQGLLLIGRSRENLLNYYKSDFMQTFLIFTSFVSTFLICSTWCAMAAIDSYVGLSGSSEAWDATNQSITPHMRWAFGLHTSAVAVAFLSFSMKLVFLFPNSVGSLL